MALIGQSLNRAAGFLKKGYKPDKDRMSAIRKKQMAMKGGDRNIMPMPNMPPPGMSKKKMMMGM